MKYSIISEVSLLISISSMCLVWYQRPKTKKLRPDVNQEIDGLPKQFNSAPVQISRSQHGVISQSVGSISKPIDNYVEISKRDIAELKRELEIMRRDISQNTLELAVLKSIIGKEIKNATPKKVTGRFETAMSSEEIVKGANKIINDFNAATSGADLAGENIVSTFADSLKSGSSSAAAAATTKRSNDGGELCAPSSITPIQKPANQTTFSGNTMIPRENIPVPSSDIPSPSALKPFQDILDKYQNAVDRNDRKTLRQMQLHELNIAAESESLLSKADFNQLTKLETVVGGGSYIIIGSNSRYWLFPTAQTLDGFSLNQPRKGVFYYESSMLPKPIVKEPAEVRKDGIYWLVIHQGSILVPR